jgi:hypothetical protein
LLQWRYEGERTSWGKQHSKHSYGYDNSGDNMEFDIAESCCENGRGCERLVQPEPHSASRFGVF